MSRVGKKIIIIPEKTEVNVDGRKVTVKGPLGQLERNIGPEVTVNISDNQISLDPRDKKMSTVALWGTYASHISNMVDGVNKPFVKELVVEGIGFKSEIKDGKLVMSLGFSHPVIFDIPEGLDVKVEKNNITVSGINKEDVGQFTAKVRASKKPEPYKGKGIRYSDEIIRRKQGKKTT